MRFLKKYDEIEPIIREAWFLDRKHELNVSECEERALNEEWISVMNEQDRTQYRSIEDRIAAIDGRCATTNVPLDNAAFLLGEQRIDHVKVKVKKRHTNEPNKILDGSETFTATKLTHQQREELSQKQFWNRLNRSRGFTKQRPLVSKQQEEREWLQAGQRRIDEFVLKREIGDREQQ